MTAIQTPGGGGYGLGFLSFLRSPAWGVDYGQNGATTVSYRAGGVEGNLTAVLAAVEGARAEFEVFVPIMVCLLLDVFFGGGGGGWRTAECK